MSDLPNVKGLADLAQKFNGTVADTKKRALRKGASAGGKFMRDAVKAGTPVGKGPHRRKGVVVPPGGLKKAAFYFFARKDSNANQAVFDVTFRKKTGFYAGWVDQGHRIVARKGKSGKTTRVRRRESNRSVPPHPFFEGAVTGAAERTAEVMVQGMSDEIAKIIRERGAG